MAEEYATSAHAASLETPADADLPARTKLISSQHTSRQAGLSLLLFPSLSGPFFQRCVGNEFENWTHFICSLRNVIIYGGAGHGMVIYFSATNKVMSIFFFFFFFFSVELVTRLSGVSARSGALLCLNV